MGKAGFSPAYNNYIFQSYLYKLLYPNTVYLPIVCGYHECVNKKHIVAPQLQSCIKKINATFTIIDLSEWGTGI